jgi:hypothetical protein
MTRAKKPADQTTVDAIALLMRDHQKVKKLFKEFEELKGDDSQDDQKFNIVEEICHELRIHAQVEEEIFYPAVRAAIDDKMLMDEADVEHGAAKNLISQLEAMEPGDDHYDAIVTVLHEEIDHHVKEEEKKMFSKAKKEEIDMQMLGQQIAQRKEELSADFSSMGPTGAGKKHKPAPHGHQ